MNSIKLLVYDFDCVMNGNKVYVHHQYKEIVQVSGVDGIVVSEISKLGDTANDTFYGIESWC